MELDAKQQEAVESCLSRQNVVGVTGAAGTGKTTVIRTVCDSLDTNEYNFALCAPTGKAARRITEITGFPALTIHKLLEFPAPGELCEKTGKPLNITRPKRNERSPLDFNYIILDEAAMCNRQLYTDLVNAIPRGGKLRMFGDLNQLAPIEEDKINKDAKSPFFDAIWKVLPRGLEPKGVILDTIHRQGAGSGIVKNGQNIIRGAYPARYDDFRLHPTVTHITVLDKLLQTADYTSPENQIIVPGHKGWVGTRKLNAVLQQKLNPDRERHQLARHKYDDVDLFVSVGDKVINNKNQYNIGLNGLMNGETGVVLEITEWGEIVVDFGIETIAIPNEVTDEYMGVLYSSNPQKDLSLAYCITTHKTQGSEYKNVIYIIDPCHKYILHRNNFYTGITRASQAVDCVFDTRAMSRALAKDQIVWSNK